MDVALYDYLRGPMAAASIALLLAGTTAQLLRLRGGSRPMRWLGHRPTPFKLIRIRDMDASFSKEIRECAGTDFFVCLQCCGCSGGCPFSEHMDYMPNGVMRLVQLGLKQEALSCNTIWMCAGCHTCSVHCPIAIDIDNVLQHHIPVFHGKGEKAVIAKQGGDAL